MKHTLLFIVCVLTSITILAQEENSPEVIDIEDSGCMNMTRSDNQSRVLVLTKEDDIISCEVQGYYANCGVRSFDIESDYQKGIDAPDSLFIDIKPIIPADMNCTCPYTVYFTIRNVKADSFFLYCWLYSGMVSFKESNQVTLEISTERVTIGGSQYDLYKPGQQAMLYMMKQTGKSELRIPSTISHEGQEYTVASIFPESLSGKETTKLILPKTLRRYGEDNAEFRNIYHLAFPKLEEVEVEPGSHLFSSVDGVLYSSDGKSLYWVPVGNKQTSYTVIDGTERIGYYAFWGCDNLQSIRIPESVTSIGFSAFSRCKNLESIYILGKLDREDYGNAIFDFMTSMPTIYVQESEVEYFKSIYTGTVLPLSSSGEFSGDEEPDDKDVKATLEGKISNCWYNLDGSQGNEAIAMIMEAPRSGAQINDNTNWNLDLLTVFIANQPKLSVTGANASEVATEFVFEEKDGFTVSSDGKTLYYENFPISTLNTSILTMVKNEKSMRLINDRASSKMKDALKLPLRVKATYMDKEVEVENGSFTVFVMRPLSAESLTIEGIKEWTNEIIKIVDLVKLYYGEEANNNNTFKSVVDSSSGEIDMYKYYGVKSITITGVTQPSDLYDVVKTNIFSDYFDDKSIFTSFSSITTKIRLVYNPTDYDSSIDAGISNISYGTLTIIDNTDSRRSYSLKIPVTVTYSWGTLKTTVYVNIGNDTSGHSKERDDGVINMFWPGTLKCFITDAEKYDVEKLVISGQLNGTDIKLLRDMAGNNVNGVPTEGKLTELDLSGASIVAGGDKYIDTDEIQLGVDHGLMIDEGFNVENDNEIGKYAFVGCNLKSVVLPNTLTKLSEGAFYYCKNLTSVTIPDGVTSIEEKAFDGCSGLTSVTIGGKVDFIGPWAFADCKNLVEVYCYAENVPETQDNAFQNSNIEDVTLYVPEVCFNAYKAIEPWKSFKKIVAMPNQNDYRPMIEDGKVWKLGAFGSGNPVQWIEYFYFDGDTIINGKTCKQMMCQRYVNPDFPYYVYIAHSPSPSKVGAWYEDDKKVYAYDSISNQFKMMYDFSAYAYDTLQIDNHSYVIGPKQTEGIKGFKGVYRDVWLWFDGESIYSVPWLEGVGSTDRPTTNVYPGNVDPAWFLMSCTVGDEVIYFNDKYEDGATPAEARKRRFDFTHTIKIQPKARNKRGAEVEQSIYGEYNDLQLGINLDPLDDAYLVRITDESGKAVYEKNVNAGNIVGLNIDISSYAEGRYTVIVENSLEAFTGEFEAQPTGIKEVRGKRSEVRDYIYNLQGQRISTLQKGLNIVNGQKVFVK